ncbi:hypothetical protein FGL01_09150 [Flavobacterium glycines]|uniref:Uncharacterized protein n=2 Tax=Flavobacterium glycines TaxID=551990 RepID=A0A511CBY6_9FLAO|nr:hypothetical protein FGL01_09150 [Flavobacterium glycines]
MSKKVLKHKNPKIMKKSIVTIGLFSLMLVLTSFTASTNNIGGSRDYKSDYIGGSRDYKSDYSIGGSRDYKSDYSIGGSRDYKSDYSIGGSRDYKTD